MAFNYQAAQFWFNVFQLLVTGLLALYVRKVSKHKATENRFKKLEDDVSGLPKKADLQVLEGKICENCNKHQARTEQIEGFARTVEKRTAQVELRATELKIELSHLPSQQQFNELNHSIATLNSELQNTQGRLSGINRAVDLMNEFLINQGAEKKS